MDIHKPKPWHGFREFLKEYLIIVVGVLTALGGEQAVEWLHRQQEVTEAREALKSEIDLDLRVAISDETEDRCWLELLGRRAAWAKGLQRRPAADEPGRGGGFAGFYATTWDVAKSSAVAHMPLAERTSYARFYALVANQQSLVEHQRDAAARMGLYVSQDRLAPNQAQRLLEETGGIRGMMGAKIANVQRLIDAGAELGVKPSPLSAATRHRLEEYCRLVRS